MNSLLHITSREKEKKGRWSINIRDKHLTDWTTFDHPLFHMFNWIDKKNKLVSLFFAFDLDQHTKTHRESIGQTSCRSFRSKKFLLIPIWMSKNSSIFFSRLSATSKTEPWPTAFLLSFLPKRQAVVGFYYAKNHWWWDCYFIDQSIVNEFAHFFHWS